MTESENGAPAPLGTPASNPKLDARKDAFKAAQAAHKEWKLTQKIGVSVLIPKTIWEQFERSARLNGQDPYEAATMLLATGMKISIQTTLEALKAEEEKRLADASKV